MNYSPLVLCCGVLCSTYLCVRREALCGCLPKKKRIRSFCFVLHRPHPHHTAPTQLSIMMRVAIIAAIAVSAFAGCDDITDCSGCTSNGCNWCPTTRTCHSKLSWFNSCNTFETISPGEAQYCDCAASCTPPPPSNDKSVCAWYTETTGSADPAQWAGGDFLPYNYREAAKCACSGCGDDAMQSDCDALWEMNLPATACVRGSLLKQHKELSDTFKQAVRDTDYLDSHDNVRVFYDMHVRAYSECCCAGEPAPYVTWLGVFYAGSVLPCTSYVGTLSSILQFGRCGCGW